jgi:hypothetical protein
MPTPIEGVTREARHWGEQNTPASRLPCRGWYDPATIDTKLGVQSMVILGDSTLRASFRNFVANVQQLQVYLAMLGGAMHMTMIHTPGVYYSIKSLTSAYKGKMMAFIGDCPATKNPTPMCLPTTKAWEWHTGNAIMDFAKAEVHYAVEANKGTLWMPGATDGPPSAMTVPNLLAIRNAFGDLLRTPGLAITPHDVLTTVDEFIQNSINPLGQQWECVQCWCVVACQTGNNGKSKVFLDTSPVSINHDKFDRWVGTKLNITLGPRPSGTTPTMMAAAVGIQGINYLTMSKMLATTNGANMMLFSQTMTPVLMGAVTAGNDTALATGKGVDQDQIAKLRDVCGMRNAQQIPPIWAVIQGSKGKRFDTYCTHLEKSIKSWYHSHHIDRDKLIFLDSKFF